MVPEAALWPFFGIGIVSCSYILYGLSQFIYTYLRSGSIRRYHHDIEPWALVTGASDGIGYAFAAELCSHGFNIILHGRNEQKLSACREQLERDFPTRQFRLFIADVTKDSSEAIAQFVESAKGLPLTVLVNNVGGTKGFLSVDFKTFSEHTPTEIMALANANMHFATLLTLALLPTLTSHQPSLILNTGSTADRGMPYLSVYAATKAYIAAWSFGLQTELEAEGLDIKVHAVLSGTTQSNQNRTAESVFNPSARAFTRAAVAKVGYGRTAVVAWWMHALMRSSVESLPERVRRWGMGSTLKRMNGKGLSDR